MKLNLNTAANKIFKAPSPNVQNVILLDNLSGDVALDNKFDNGIYNSGNVRGSSVYTAFVACLGISP
jgi:hypothetical protein